MESKIVRSGNTVYFMKGLGNLNYILEPGTVYEAKYDDYEQKVFLEIKNSFSLPSQVYKTDRDDAFLHKVIESYKASDNKTTGVLLTGLKGSGKTVMSKLIAKNANLPIINVSRNFGLRNISELIKALNTTSACILIDELDKIPDNGYNSHSHLLGVLDGIDTINKHIFIITANNLEGLNDYIKDRCSRIRYSKNYGKLNKDLIIKMVNDRLKDTSKIETVTNFILEKITVASIDNIMSFIDEINNFPEYSIEDLFEDMNLS